MFLRRLFVRRRASAAVPQPEPYVPSAVLNRRLTVDEDAALRWILYVEDVPGAEQLRTQVDSVVAVFGRTTDLELRVDGGEKAQIGDGHFPSAALVVDENEEPTGHIDLWVKGGWLDAIEYSWFTDRMPTEYPPAERLRLFDPTTSVAAEDHVTLPGAG